MKQEATKKPKKLLWLWIGLASLVLVAGAVVGAILLFGGKGPTGPVGGRPDLYWNLDKEFYTKDSESGLSTREAGEDGVFRVRFAYNGEQVELPVADKQLVNFIDTMDIMGLVKDSDGVVVDVIAVEDIATPVAQNAYVQQVVGDKIIANSSIAMNGMQYTIELCDLTQMYDISDTAEVAGQIIDASAFEAMDSIWVYANDLEEVTHIYMTDHSATSPVYWRAYQMWNGTEKSTSRVPDENGVYSIDFCCDGEIVTLKCKDKSIVTSIDNKSPHSCHFGFVFDEEGYIIEIMNSGIGIRGAVAAERIDVLELDGNYFAGTQLITSDSGLSYSATLPEDCIIYDASTAAMREGRQGKPVDSLQLNDRICVWTDPMGTPVMVYIANRLADCDAYFNLSRKYDGTKKETTREPDWAGYYTFEVVKAGETGKKTVKTKDKEVATFIDAISNRVVGMKVENGIIKYAYADDDIYGWSSVWEGYIPQIQGTIASFVSFSRPDSPTNVLMTPGYKAYDITGKDVPYGTETTLRVGDIATVTRDVSCNGLVAFVIRRLVDGDNNAYYNLDYQFNNTTKETMRVPDAEGYYVFTMAHKGKQVTVKTKDKELASKIDQSPVGDLVCIMRVENGIAYELYDTQSAYGQVLRSGYRVKSINADGTYTVYAGDYEFDLKMADDCIMYNVSTVYDSHRGERCYSIKPGDMVTTLADYRGYAKLIYVRQRCTDNIYINKQRMYDTGTKLTLREPDAEGKYWFELAVDGEIKKFWTKSLDIASQVDAYTTPFGARVKGDEILNVTAAVYAGKARSTPYNGWDVTSAGKWSIGLQFNKVGYGNTGEKKSVNLSSNVKVFDISPTAKQFGEKVELKKGDRILAYADIDGNICYIYVLFHDSRVKGSVGYCEHCKQEVKWLPWAGGSWDGYDAHYYLAGDVQYSGQSNIGNNTKDYEIVLDLNGCKYEAIGSRGFLIRYNDQLTIIDSVGGGSLAGTGINGGNGGTFMLSGNGILNLYSGTLTFVDHEAISIRSGSVIYAAYESTINMYGGTITGGIVNTSDENIQYAIDNTKIPEPPEKPKSPNINVLGGNIHIQQSTVLNIYGGVIENGQAVRSTGKTWEYGNISECAAQGGNIYAGGNSVINLYDGAEIRNGYSNQHGGNVFLATATLNMLGGKIHGGVCDSYAGNLYNQFGAVANISGGVIENGTAGTVGNNIYVSHDTGELHLSGGKITGDITMGNGKAVSISGTAKVTMGKNCGLSIPSKIKLSVGELKNGAEVYINAKGAFSEANAKNQSYVDAGYIKAASSRTDVIVKDNVLVMQGEITYCEHCNSDVEWSEWTGVDYPTSGHYFVAKDFHQPRQLVIETDVVLDLYGHKYTSTKIRNFLVRGTLSIMDSVGGGEMITTCDYVYHGGIAMVGNSNGTPSGFNLYSGTLKLDTDYTVDKPVANAGLIQFKGDELNIYGGTMIGGHVTQNGGCIYSGGAASVVNIYGGTLTGGTADGTGDIIYSKNVVNVYGGNVDGEIYIESGVSSLAGAPVVGELFLAKGALVDISGLETGANIGINAEGVFTTEVEAPADYLQYLHSVDELKDILPLDDALAMNLGKAFFDKYNSIHTVAEQMTTDGVFAAGGTITAVCPVCGTEEQWIDIATVANMKSINTEGHYYLSSDINLTNNNHIGFYADACLHLNGNNITSTERGFYVEATASMQAKLNIMGNGIVTAAGIDQRRGTVDIGGSVNFFGGTYVASGNNPTLTARGFNGVSVVNIYDGAEFAGVGTNLMVISHGVNVYGGKFTSGASTVNGASANALNIYGGTFNGNGRVITASGAKGALNISGGTFNGTVFVGEDLGAFTVSGETVITQLDLTSGKIAVFQNLYGNAKIGVNAVGAFTSQFNKAKAYLDAQYIVPANSGITLYEENSVLYAEVEKVYCPHCDDEVEWMVWPGYSSPVSGHYYIDGDYTQTAQFSIVNNTDVVIDLRGNLYSSTKIRNFLVRGSLSIVDTVGGGKMVTTCGAEFAGGIALVGGDSATTGTPTVNVYGGTLELDVNNAAFEKFANGGLFWVNGGALNIYGGTVKGGHVTQSGGCIKISGTSTVLNIFDGTITGGTAGESGGCIYTEGITNIQGGIIEGEIYVTSDNVTISDTVKIAKLNVAEGMLVDVSGLGDGSEIGIVANGVFTKPLTSALDYLTFFTKINDADEIYVDGDSLAAKTVDPIEAANAIHTVAEKMTVDGVFNAGGTVTAKCPVCGTEEQWIDMATVSNLRSIKTAGHYYLSDNVNITDANHIGFYADACLHLNGKNITSTERAIYVDADHTLAVPRHVKLNIMGAGILTGAGQDNASIPRGALDIGGSVNIYGGTYVTSTSQNPSVTSRGYYNNAKVGTGVTNIYDGAEFISSNTSVLVRSGIVNVYGGKFTSGVVKVDGAGYCDFNIYGGTFENTNAGQSEVINAAGKQGTLTVAGGVINGKVNVAADLKKVAVSGTPVIADLDLTSGKLLTIGELEMGADILVTANDAFTDTLSNATSVVISFGAADPAKEVAAVNNKLVVRESLTAKYNKVHELAEKMTADNVFGAGGVVTAVCPVCGTEEQWEDLANVAPATSLKAEKHYYLSKDVQNTTFYRFYANACLHLNGKNITSTERAIYVDADHTVPRHVTLNIMGEGIVSGPGKSQKEGTVDVGGSVNFFGGTYKATGSYPAVTARGYYNNANIGTCVVSIYDGAQFTAPNTSVQVTTQVVNMYGGAITAGAVKVDGTNACEFNVFGGSIANSNDGQNAINAAGAKATLMFAGGNISGKVSVASNVKTVSVSRTAVISDLDLTSGKKLSMGVMKSGAEINVTADGVFTEGTSIADKFVGFFKAAADGKKVVVKGNALAIVNE